MQDLLVDAVGALVAALVAGGVLWWGDAWSRQRGRFAMAAVATFVAWIAWHGVLRLSDGDNLDVDNPLLLGLSAEDVGSGVLAFLFAALPLGLWRERAEPAQRVIGAAAIAGALAILVDRFI